MNAIWQGRRWKVVDDTFTGVVLVPYDGAVEQRVLVGYEEAGLVIDPTDGEWGEVAEAPELVQVMDGGAPVFFVDAPGIDEVICAWRVLDQSRPFGGPFTHAFDEFMATRGFIPLVVRKVDL